MFVVNELYLSPDDIASHEALDLLDRTKHFLVPHGFRAESVQPGDPLRQVFVEIVVTGRHPDEKWRNYQRIVRILERPGDSGMLLPGAERAVLIVRLGTSHRVMFDIQKGDAVIQEHFADDQHMSVLLQLDCLPYARGQALLLPESEIRTVADGVVPIGHVPGDVPPLTQLVVRDRSVNDQRIRRLRVGRIARRSGIDLQSLRMIHPVEPTGSGLIIDDPGAVGGIAARTQSNPHWQSVAHVRQDASLYSEIGYFDVIGLVRDYSVPAPSPGGLIATPSSDSSVAVRQTTSNDAETNQVSLTLDQTVAGNYLHAIFVGNGSQDVIGPGGWTELSSELVGTTSNTYLRKAIYRRTATGSEASVTFRQGVNAPTNLMSEKGSLAPNEPDAPSSTATYLPPSTPNAPSSSTTFIATPAPSQASQAPTLTLQPASNTQVTGLSHHAGQATPGDVHTLMNLRIQGRHSSTGLWGPVTSLSSQSLTYDSGGIQRFATSVRANFSLDNASEWRLWYQVWQNGWSSWRLITGSGSNHTISSWTQGSINTPPTTGQGHAGLTVNTYNYRFTDHSPSGGESTPGPQRTQAVSVAGSRIHVSGHSNRYRLYFGAGTTNRFVAFGTSYTHSSTTAGTVGSPPTSPTVGLTSGTWEYRVAARSGSDNWSPAGASHTRSVAAGYRINVSWSSVAGASQYRLYFRRGTGAWRYIQQTGQSYQHSSDTAGTAGTPSTVASGSGLDSGTYYYRVSAIYDTDESVASAQHSRTVSGNGAHTINVSWVSLPEATAYRIYHRREGDAWRFIQLTETSYTHSVRGTGTLGDPPLTPTTENGLAEGTYHYRVTWLDSGDNESPATSQVTHEVSDIEDVQVNLSWDSVTQANSYRVYWQHDSGSWRYETVTTNSYGHQDENAGESGQFPTTVATTACGLTIMELTNIDTETAGGIHAIETITGTSATRVSGQIETTIDDTYLLASIAYLSNAGFLESLGGYTTHITRTIAGDQSRAYAIARRNLEVDGTFQYTRSYSESEPFIGANVALTRDVAGELPAGDYRYRVASVDPNNNVSAASSAVTAQVIENGQVELNWNATPNTVEYRVYWQRDDGFWNYHVTTNSSYIHTTESGAIMADPSDSGTTTGASVRLRVGLAGSSFRQPLTAQTIRSESGSLTPINFGTVHLPPIVPPEHGSMPRWAFEAQARHASTQTDIDFCGFYLFPHQEMSQLLVEAHQLPQPGTWIFDRHRDGRVSCRIVNNNGNIIAHANLLQGDFGFGAGENIVVVFAEGYSGVDLNDIRFSVQAHITPRYLQLRAVS